MSTVLNESAETMVVADGGVLPIANLRNASNWRAFVHQIVPVIVSALVTMNIVTGDMATAWVPFIFALADNLLSVGNTTDRVRRAVIRESRIVLATLALVAPWLGWLADRVRRAIYAGVGVLQAGGLVTMLVTDVAPAYVPVAGAVLAVASAFLARFYVPTTTIVPKEI